MILVALAEAAERGELLICDGGLCRWHRSPEGEDHGNSRLTAELVMVIRRRAAAGESYASVARDLGMSATHVSCVARGKNWKHLPME